MPGTPSEKLLRAALREFGVRFTTQDAVLDSYPTVILRDIQVAVFVDDCFESRCPWHYPRRKSVRLWNVLNDRDHKLRKEGWTVVRVWQHEVEANPRTAAGRISLIVRTVRSVLKEAESK